MSNLINIGYFGTLLYLIVCFVDHRLLLSVLYFFLHH